MHVRLGLRWPQMYRRREGTPPVLGSSAATGQDALRAGPFWERHRTYVAIPFWLVALVLGPPTVVLWRRDWHVPPGHCLRCGYDLTGNVSGRCPECGMQVSAAAVRAASG